MTMYHRARTATTAQNPPQNEVNIFRTALRLIGQGFVEIAQGIGLIAEGTLRPVRRLVPSFVALASIAGLTTVTLVGIITTVARTDLGARGDATWTRWSHSPEIRFGDNTLRASDVDHLTETVAWEQDPIETIYVARQRPER